MRILDRASFQKECLLSAASIFDKKTISRVRAELVKSQDMFTMRNITSIRDDPVHARAGRKCILLRPEIKHNDKMTWSETTTRLANQGDIDVIPFKLHLNYDHWSAHDILTAVLPKDLHDEIPTGFNAVGHVAHFNLRDKYLPYKTIIAQVTLTKNPPIETVINKTETVDESHSAHNPFRTLDYEVLAGPANLDVELKEAGCTFRFDFGRVFWNSRLQADHTRMVEMFEPDTAVCDVMAGVGPFAVPAGKEGVFVWANDLNPYCFEGLKDAVELNKVGKFVKSFCEDGHEFIRSAARRLLEERHVAKVPMKMSRTEALQRRKETSLSVVNGVRSEKSPPASLFKTVHAPPTFDHFVMNLPASAIEFLPSFIGIYANHEHLFKTKESAAKTESRSASTSTIPETTNAQQKRRLPMIHCYCFGPKSQVSGETNGDSSTGPMNGHVETGESSTTQPDTHLQTNSNPITPTHAQIPTSNHQPPTPSSISSNDDILPDQTLIARRISAQLGTEIYPDDDDVNIRQVRLVAPNKWEYCASFRLPAEVAFRKPGGGRRQSR
ncbi:MAG: tRNA(m(1)G37)methyltransferase [Alyxoria varia]|nr:MAG: tRNA(m(1)G37)methyltransferase [Alyxoria varia]